MRRLRKLFAALIMAALLLPALLTPAHADTVTDTITIAVGYFGWAEEDYIEKVTYHWTELDDLYGGALDTRTEIYSYYSGSRTYLVAARGFTIRDLLSYAGIDLWSIGSIDFFTKDHVNGAYRSFSAYSLLSMPRYYFPNLAANEETGEIYAYDGDDIWNGASTVESMLALEDYTEWGVSGTEFEQLYDPAMLNPNCRFHLFFGQSQPSEASTSSAAKYCYKILVTFSGTPVLGTDETDMELKIGSGHKLELTVDAEDGLLNDYVRNHITWSSSDNSIVAVSQDGTIRMLSPGEAVVTASFGNSSVSVTVRASDEPAEPGTGAGAGTGTGTASTGTTDAPPAQTPSQTPEIPPQTDAPEPPPTEAPSAAVLTPEPEPSAAPVELPDAPRIVAIPAAALLGTKPGDPDNDEQNGGRMEEDSTQLVLTLPVEKDQTLLVAGALLLAFALGALYGVIRFKRELRGKRT